MANYPAHSKKQSLPHCPDPQPKTAWHRRNPISLNRPAHTPQDNKKWATFTFTSPNIRKVTNLFKQAGVKIVSGAKTHSHA